MRCRGWGGAGMLGRTWGSFQGEDSGYDDGTRGVCPGGRGRWMRPPARRDAWCLSWYVSDGAWVVRTAWPVPCKHLSTGFEALASGAQWRLNARKRRYIWRHHADQPGNPAT